MSRERWIVSPLQVLRETFPTSVAGFWALTGVVLAGKLAWLLWAGPAYEMDTATYLESSLTFHHPPLYGWLLLGLERIWPQAYFVAAAQSLLFAAATALTCAHFGRSPRETLLLAVAFAVDPITSFFATELMSEALFVPLTMLWLCLVNQYAHTTAANRRRTALVLVACGLALLYSVRLAAIVFPGFFLLVAWWRSGTPRLGRAVAHTVMLVLLLQLFISPVKLLYWQKFDTYAMTTFSGVNLWNNACVLYPDSSVRQSPDTEFERFLATRGTEEFTTINALHGNTIHEPYSAYHTYVSTRVHNFEENKALSESLGRTSRRLILENPVGYFTRFILPNYLKPLTLSEEIPISPRVEELLKRRLSYTQPHHVRYYAITWILWLGVATAATGVQWLVPGRRDRPAQILLLFVWFYVLALPPLSASCLRYVLLCTAPILIAAWRTLIPSRLSDSA